MKNLAIAAAFLVALGGCQGGPADDVTAIPGKGAISVQIVPNPIVAKPAPNGTYTFPFEVVVRETGGRPVEIQTVDANVLLGGALSLGRESWDGKRIRSLGYSTTLPARGEMRYRFSPTKEVPDERLFTSVSADLTVEALDDTGAPTSATTNVTITR